VLVNLRIRKSLAKWLKSDRLSVSASAKLRRPVKAIAIYLSIAAGRMSLPF
jgi:hypothetical protein